MVMNNEASPAIEPLGVGDVVLLRNPGEVLARVARRREGDFGLPEEESWYEVQVIPLKKYCQRTEMTPENPPPSDSGRLEYLSQEWVDELASLHDKVTRWRVKQGDKELLREVSQSMGRLGFPV
jgi:hypothetical protein